MSVRSLLFGWLLFVATAAGATDIEVKGLFSNSALLIIDGQQRLLKTGERSPEGVKLLSATSAAAIVEIDGKRHELALSRRIASRYSEAELPEVRIAGGPNGHYFVKGLVNGQSIDFLVDTGASTIAMNAGHARRLGLNYKRGRVVNVSTANGMTTGYQVNARSVEIGGIALQNVTITVTEGQFPEHVLLGNSFLSRVDMRVENGLLILQAKF